MSILSSLFKKKKPNLTPDIQPPSIEDLKFTSDLESFAKQRMQNPPGFGEDFLDRMTFAPIAQREARFREIEKPEIEASLSARGIQRSAGPGLATDILTRAGQAKERDINSLVQQFTLLNLQQKKADERLGVDIAGAQQGLDAQLKQAQAAASERLAGATAKQQLKFQEQDREMAKQMIGLGATSAKGFIDPSLFIPGMTTTDPTFVQRLAGALSGAGSINQSATDAKTKQRLDEIEELLKKA